MAMPYRLDDLIAAVSEDTEGGDPLTAVAGAVQTAEQLAELADHLVGHFVDEARKSGASWAEIGANLGVTRQAAQKRFVAPKAEEPKPVPTSSFDRFSDAAREAASAAISRARKAQRDAVGGEDLFLGLLDQLDAVAEQAFDAFEVPLEQVREAAIKAFGQPGSPLDGPAPDATETQEPAPADGAAQVDEEDSSPDDEVWQAFERSERESGPTGIFDSATEEDEQLPPFPFGRDAARFLQMALREALRSGSGSVGTEHLLRGVLRDDTSPAWNLLRGLGITRAQAEQWLRDQA